MLFINNYQLLVVITNFY